jgi:hypothetical protein
MKLIEYEQPTSLPVPKVAAVAAAGTIVTGIVSVLAISGVIVPDSVSQAAVNAVAAAMIALSALQTLITFAAGYFKKDAKPAPVVDEIKRSAVK